MFCKAAAYRCCTCAVPTFLLFTVPRPSEDMMFSSICLSRCSFISSLMGSPFAVTLSTKATLEAYVQTCTMMTPSNPAERLKIWSCKSCSCEPCSNTHVQCRRRRGTVPRTIPKRDLVASRGAGAHRSRPHIAAVVSQQPGDLRKEAS